MIFILSEMNKIELCLFVYIDFKEKYLEVKYYLFEFLS